MISQPLFKDRHTHVGVVCLTVDFVMFCFVCYYCVMSFPQIMFTVYTFLFVTYTNCKVVKYNFCH